MVIHSGPDDFTSQPAGNAGTKIACGMICSK
jgi:Cu-Zn family superoxide dismutase